MRQVQLDQKRTPLFDALKKYVDDKTVQFHVPGHKQGKGIPEFMEVVGKNTLAIDLTCLPDTDNICNSVSTIKHAQQLAAQAYKADHAFFLVNGTTYGIQAMIMAVCEPGDKIIIPRNAHKSAVGGLILSGAHPIYIEPEIHPEFGISMGITPEAVERTLHRHPDAKAIFVVYPTYYGCASDLRSIVDIAHTKGIPVVVDEAHGAHLVFHEELPISAMECGADLSANSTHKLAGSMTQSSILLLREGLVNPLKVKSVLNLTQTTSPSYVLMASLDIARKQMATKGKELLSNTLKLVDYVRKELSRVNGLELLDDNVIGQYGCVDFDRTKVTVNVLGLGMSGYEMEKILRKEYRLQVELSDLYNVIFLITIGDDWESVKYLVESVKAVAAGRSKSNVIKYCPLLPEIPELAVSPREAFYSDTKFVPFDEAEGEICAEMIMAYPPGIPLVLPGERITREIISYVEILKKENAELQGAEDPEINYIKVLQNRLVLIQSEPDINENIG